MNQSTSGAVGMQIAPEADTFSVLHINCSLTRERKVITLTTDTGSQESLPRVNPNYNRDYYYIAHFFASLLIAPEAVVILPTSFIQHNFWVAIFLAIFIAAFVEYIIYMRPSHKLAKQAEHMSALDRLELGLPIFED